MNRAAFYILCAVTAVGTATLGQNEQYKIGRLATAEEIRELDISVAPNGSGLPKGSGTVSQGQHIYQTLCANCHGDRGQGMLQYPALVGGRSTLRSNNPVRTVGSYWPYATTAWDYIHRTMPYPRPGSLTPDETYAVTAFILYLNGIVDEKAELNEATLPRVKMPNRDGFVGDPRPDVPTRKIAN
ncbi:MAG: cytochrome c [Candidatus Acidiferrales bacterium]